MEFLLPALLVPTIRLVSRTRHREVIGDILQHEVIYSRSEVDSVRSRRKRGEHDPVTIGYCGLTRSRNATVKSGGETRVPGEVKQPGGCPVIEQIQPSPHKQSAAVGVPERI